MGFYIELWNLYDWASSLLLGCGRFNSDGSVYRVKTANAHCIFITLAIQFSNFVALSVQDKSACNMLAATMSCNAKKVAEKSCRKKLGSEASKVDIFYIFFVAKHLALRCQCDKKDVS